MRKIDAETLKKTLADHKEWRASAGSRGTRANLARADLAGADLTGADLARADLADANLTRADLNGANLARADLTGADLTDADLTDANLTRANLTGADLTDADLTDANLTRADLTGANLADARNVPAGVIATSPAAPYERKPGRSRADRAARYRERHPEVPVVENLDAKTLAMVEAQPDALDMSQWHSCETTHCLAGWAIHHAGKAGYELEAIYGPAVAGRMIYLASTGHAPHFFATNEGALEGLRRRAEEQTNAQPR